MNVIKDQLIKKQIRNNAIIVCILDIIFFVILCFLKKYNLLVLFGLILGSSYSVLNFIFIAISTEKLVFSSVDLENKNKIKSKAVFYYYIRYLLMAIVIIIAIKINKIDNLAFLVSLFFSKIAIFVQAFLE